MDETWKGIVWRQFGAAIDMLGDAIRACPDEVWDDGSPRPFWYIAYHTLFFLDLCLSGSTEEFAPPEPFTLAELDPSGVMPERTYTQAELLAYVEHGGEKCRATIDAMTDEEARRKADLFWLDFERGELLLHNLRHVQHHAAQLYLILRQTTNSAPGWVKVAR